jgi:hypothetical protein
MGSLLIWPYPPLFQSTELRGCKREDEDHQYCGGGPKERKERALVCIARGVVEESHGTDVFKVSLCRRFGVALSPSRSARDDTTDDSP